MQWNVAQCTAKGMSGSDDSTGPRYWYRNCRESSVKVKKAKEEGRKRKREREERKSVHMTTLRCLRMRVQILILQFN